ncbi:cyclic nucleotide-binding/CBS domain-containing protein [Streptomyces sp. IMTB 2501]|uniref:CBS domain-containing protein n=1 Tax=Streptomyces sp. IMTB 2501 TaxID=1776340 RepID=UPI002116C2F2|nr:CBS domain-containing protein [Streptomyces sp. IMTB 2501]
MKVSEVMTAPPVCVAPDVSLAEVTRRMTEYAVGSVLVVEDGAPYGIVTDRDLAVRGMGGGLDAEAARVDTVMSPRTVTVEAGDDFQVATRRSVAPESAGFRFWRETGWWGY